MEKISRSCGRLDSCSFLIRGNSKRNRTYGGVEAEFGRLDSAIRYLRQSPIASPWATKKTSDELAAP